MQNYGGDITWVPYYDKLDTPTVKVSNASNGVKVTWNKIAGATSYKVYRKTSGGSWTAIKSGLTGLTYTDTTAKSGTAYYYTVRAVNGAQQSSYKASSAIKRLAQPTVTLSNAATGMKISWGKVNGATKYVVYRCTNGKSWKSIATVTGTTYTDKTAKSGTTYYYTVRAVSGSTYSSYITTKKLVRLAQPTVTLSNASTGMKISWGKVTGATKYVVYRCTNGKSWKSIATVTGTTYTDKTAKSGTTYYYTVRAVKGATYSSYITTKKLVRLAQPVTKVSAVTGGVKVSWGKITGASSYKVYRKTSTGSWVAIKSGLTGTSYTDKTAVKGRTYYYTVRAVKGTQQSSYTASKAVKRTK